MPAFFKHRCMPLGLAILLIVAVASLISGCENNISVLDQETGLYSVYGALDINADTNYIRVRNLNTPLVGDSTRTLEATVTFENSRTGTSMVLEDSIVQFEGVYTHNFRTTADITPNTEYRVTVEHPDGRTAQATATTPAIAKTSVDPRGGDCETPIRITFDPVASAGQLDPELGFNYGGTRRWTPTFRPQTTGVAPGQVFLQFTPKQLLDAVFKPDSPFGGKEVWCHELDSEDLYVRYTHFGPDFSEDSSSDSLNVPGGIGQFGGFYEDSFEFEIDTANVCAPFC